MKKIICIFSFLFLSILAVHADLVNTGRVNIKSLFPRGSNGQVLTTINSGTSIGWGVGYTGADVNGDILELLPTNGDILWNDSGALGALAKGTNGQVLTVINSGADIGYTTFSGGGGEVNTASNNGTGLAVYKKKDGFNLQFHTINNGDNTIDIAYQSGNGIGMSVNEANLVGVDAATLDTLDSLQFLRSDTSDAYTSGTLTLNAGTTFDVNSTNVSIADTNISLDGASTTFTQTTGAIVLAPASGSNVGINQASPTHKVDIDTSTHNGMRLSGATSMTGVRFRFEGSSTPTGSIQDLYTTYGDNIPTTFFSHGYNVSSGNYEIATGEGLANARFWITSAGNTTVNGTLAVETNTFVVNATSNNVGIGTTTPDAELQINGDLLLVANGQYQQSFYTDAEVDDGNSGTADTIDWRLGNQHKSTLTGNVTYTFTAPGGPTNLILKLIQDNGSNGATFPAAVKWPGGTACTLTTTANGVDLVGLYYDGTNYYAQCNNNYQ